MMTGNNNSDHHNPDPAQLNTKFESAHPREVIEWVVERFGRDGALMSSFGVEDVALIDLAWRVDPNVRVMTLDTWRLPTETYTVIDRIKDRYGIDIEVFTPDPQSVAGMVDKHGFNLFYRSIENRKMCCGIRKVEPLNRALSSLDAWVTGLRRDQGMARGTIDIVEWDESHDAWKVNPLSNWSFEQVQAYVRDNEVPYNELHDQGFPSIGCSPCTRAVEPGEDLRAGRWWWEQDPDAKECGLHVVERATR